MQAFLQRYSWAVYLIVLLISAFLLYLGWDTRGALSNALTGVGSSLFAVFVVFVVADRMFLLRNFQIAERMEALLNSQRRPVSELLHLERGRFESLAVSSQRIDLCGVMLSTTIKQNKTLLHSALMRGCYIRILLMNPKSDGVDAAAYRSELNNAESYRSKALEVFEDIRQISMPWGRQGTLSQSAAQPGTLETRLLRFPPTFGLCVLHQQNESFAIVELYPHKSPDRSPTLQLESRSDGEWYRFFEDQFEKLWSEGTPRDNDAPTSESTATPAL